MTTLTIRVALSLALLLASSAARAQLVALRNTSPQTRATVQTKLMEEKLGLSGEALQKVSAINLEYANKMQEVLEGAEQPLEEMLEIKQIAEQKDAMLKQVMSAKQFQQYQDAKTELKQQFEERMSKEAGGTGASPQ
jgi:hypothetical protein